MRNNSYLIERIIEPDNLRRAFWKAAKGKRRADQVIRYNQQLDQNLLRLREQIRTGLVVVGDYHRFKVYEPKERQVCAPAFQEQVLHHALMNVCHEHFERFQIFDSYASRKGKGTHAALERAKVFTRQNAWFLKLDVRKFFDSVHHEVIKSQLRRLFADYRLLDIFEKIIDSYETSPERGVPIGNLSSQYFSNHYLAPLDHFIKEKLRVSAYVRYMDDMVLWQDNPNVLKKNLEDIQQYTENSLLCSLKPVQLNRTGSGLPFLGYHLFPYDVRLLQQSKRRFIRKLHFANEQWETGAWSEAVCQRHVQPLLAFTQHANTAAFRRKIGQSP